MYFIKGTVAALVFVIVGRSGEGSGEAEINDTLADGFKSQFADEDTQGIVVIAHGDPHRKGDFSDAGPDYVSPAEAGAVLHHKLGAFKAIWCWSGVKAKEWRALVSPTGVFYSNPGKCYIWHAQPGVIEHGF